jgi:uncharacterized protein YdiU (UPF0061 family)
MINFDNTYARLPDRFYERIFPALVPDPKIVRINDALAKELQLDPAWLRSADGLAMLSGNQLPKNADPIAQAYAGHQFGGWSPQLGDGRAVLIGEVIDTYGNRRDIQLKGSGQTSFSRRGDGKSTLGAVIREYVVSEAMAALGAPSTRALAAVTTGEVVPRMQAHPGGIFTRVAASHIRVGTFQYYLGLQDFDGIEALADYAINRHYPACTDSEEPYIAFLEQVALNQARLIAHWMQLGFIHGVMNTDNMTISGETIDFGPCAFMEEFHPDTVFSSIDQHGRYAWGNQANVGYWNLERLGEALAPLISKDTAVAQEKVEAVLKRYLVAITAAYFSGFGRKLGITTVDEPEKEFITHTLRFMAERQLDFTLFFRHLTRDPNDLQSVLGEISDLKEWQASWDAITGGSSDERINLMRKNNPIRIPRNHRVEQAIQASESGDYARFNRLVDALATPFNEASQFDDLEAPAEPHEVVRETFCGT